MNDDKHVALERLAREAGLHNDGQWWFDGDSNAQCDVSTAALARFAALVRADALEQAAAVCQCNFSSGALDLADAIRALKDAK